MKIETSIRLLPDDQKCIVNVCYGKTFKSYTVFIDRAMMDFPDRSMVQAVCKAAKRIFKNEMGL